MQHIDNLITAGIEIRHQIDDLKKQLDAISEQLIALAVFEPGKATTYVNGDTLKAKVVNRCYEKWDQEKLNAARAAMGDEAFMEIFDYFWSPKSKKDIQGFIKHADPRFSQLIKDALTTRTTPAIQYEVDK